MSSPSFSFSFGSKVQGYREGYGRGNGFSVPEIYQSGSSKLTLARRNRATKDSDVVDRVNVARNLDMSLGYQKSFNQYQGQMAIHILELPYRVILHQYQGKNKKANIKGNTKFGIKLEQTEFIDLELSDS
ncbi:hypothetical protein C5167_050276 [Papaver somniferum]|uniref:Uncharacterized protein n=1 Tax=Papaver somniferum TaxID=3469 RepID=A0A4Y7KPL2_PAPSO|nr:hypothetical protein C5167_050276 [Papaver somniferum]